MASPCLRLKCIECCLETEMLLLDGDVERLAGLGFRPDDFSIESDGWLEIRNRGGRCVFHDGAKCLVYNDRPEGCRSYPVVQGKAGAVLDSDCPHGGEFSISPEARERLSALVARLKAERKMRQR